MKCETFEFDDDSPEAVPYSQKLHLCAFLRKIVKSYEVSKA